MRRKKKILIETVDLHCELDWILNHLGDTPLSISREVKLRWEELPYISVAPYHCLGGGGGRSRLDEN